MVSRTRPVSRAAPFASFVALAAFGSAAVACSAAAESTKKPLPVCDADDAACPGVPASPSPKKPLQEVPTDPVPAPAADPAPAEPAADAGPASAPDAAPVMGDDCKALDACCKQLGEAGYDTTRCKSVLSTNNEDACYTQHASYKSFGDCS